MKRNATALLAIGLVFLTSVATLGDLPEARVNARRPSLIEGTRIQPPLDFCGEPVPLDNQEVRERLEKEMLITLGDRPQAILWLKRSRRYLPIIEKMLAQSRIPEDIKYVAIAESALRPHAGSPAGAIGFWQFMRPTAQRYGLVVDSDLDERRSVFKSTRAAIAYFTDLHADLGSWTLAAAAFNMGEEGLKSEILLQKTRDYYRLYLPLETQRYIFRILSAKLIISNPQRYGFHLTDDDIYPPLKFERVEVVCSQRTPITIVARAAGTYFKKIKDLNPDIRGYFLPEGIHVLLLPEGAAEKFHARFETELQTWEKESGRLVHVVQPGDNLSTIADLYRVPLPALLMWNDLNPHKHIHPGDQLIIYAPARPENEPETQ
jgi:hypothetical protein